VSAIIAVRASDAIHLLTDGATTASNDGRLVTVQSKQIATRTDVVIAGVGIWEPCLTFARLIDERRLTFDQLVPAIEELWNKARENLPPRAFEISFATLVAGYSVERARLELRGAFSIAVGDTTASNPEKFLMLDDIDGYIGVPSVEAREVIDPLTKRWGENPDEFDPRRDGVALMERLRRECPRPYERGRQPAVGGFVQLTTVRRDSISTSVIHQWPDRLWRVIDADAAVEPAYRDPFGYSMPELFRIREDRALKEFRIQRAEPPPLVMGDLRKLANVLVAGMTPEEMAELRQG
jgi:hypothetical protein